MNAEVVPFGKYKGQPAEALIADQDYCQWLTAQPWFRDRWPNVYNVVINYSGEPQDSPEHNEMQARFLDDDWCYRLGAVLWPRAAGLAEVGIFTRDFERSGWDVALKFALAVNERYGERSILVSDDGDAAIECKPDLGDDYPAVLRQVKGYPTIGGQHRRRCVIARRHEFQHVTWDQVCQIFAASHIVLIAEDRITNAQPMQWVEGVR